MLQRLREDREVVVRTIESGAVQVEARRIFLIVRSIDMAMVQVGELRIAVRAAVEHQNPFRGYRVLGDEALELEHCYQAGEVDSIHELGEP